MIEPTNYQVHPHCRNFGCSRSAASLLPQSAVPHFYENWQSYHRHT